MNKKYLFVKVVVIGVIVLFFGASVVLGISGKNSGSGLIPQGEIMDAPITSDPIPMSGLPDGDWDYQSNPPHLFSIPSGNVGIGGVPPVDSKLFVLSEMMAWQYGLNVSSGLGIRSVSTAWEGTGIYGEGGHIGVSGNGFIGIYGSGFHGGWFDGHGYFSGNLGVGEHSEGSRLHVEGDIFCNGSLIGGDHDHNDLYYNKSEIDALLAETSASSTRIDIGEFNGEVVSDYVEHYISGEWVHEFDTPFTCIDPPEMMISVVLKQASTGLTEGDNIKPMANIIGSSGNWTGFEIMVSKYSDGSSIVDTTDVYVNWLAVSSNATCGDGGTEIVTGIIPWDNNPSYTVGTGFIIDVSDDIPSGFTLVDVFAKGRKTHQMTGDIQDEPPLNLYPKVNGTNIAIQVWDADKSEYGGSGWSSRSAHINYTLFMKRS